MRSTTTDQKTVKHRLHRRRWAIMANYPIWDDEWIRALSDDDARRLLAIFEALRRVDRGTYGICVNCGSVVDIERLMALPEAAVCVVCATFAAEPHARAVH